MIDKFIISRALNTGVIKSPERPDKYVDPYDNLLYALLVRAMQDVNGYINRETHEVCDGSDAIEFLDSAGRKIFKHLETSEKTPIDNDTELGRKKSAARRKIKIG